MRVSRFGRRFHESFFVCRKQHKIAQSELDRLDDGKTDDQGPSVDQESYYFDRTKNRDRMYYRYIRAKRSAERIRR
jgi:hypothetical protein